MTEATLTPPEDREAMLQKANDRAIRRLMHKNAVDMQAVQQAVWENSGGIEGWVRELDALKRRAINEGDNTTVFKVLKMNIDLTEKAQAAGKLAVDDMSDDELDAIIQGHVKQMAKDNPELIKTAIVAQAKSADPSSLEFMQ